MVTVENQKYQYAELKFITNTALRIHTQPAQSPDQSSRSHHPSAQGIALQGKD